MKPLFIKEFVPKQIFNILNSYSIIKYSNLKNIEPCSQSNSLITQYADPLMETLMDMSTGVIEQNVGKKLFPTYSFFRIYDKGSDLPIHVDRPSCEYTVALCLGCEPDDKPYNIYVGEEDKSSDYRYYDRKKKLVNLKINHAFEMLPNNALIFQGMENLHWREECHHDHFITVFLHYVDQEGKYSEHKYDKRDQLGLDKIK